MSEIWKDIPGFEGYYQASSLGRIKRLETYVKHNYGGLFKVKEHIVEGIVTNGNRKHTLSKNGKNKPFSTSQIIALTFLPKPERAKKVIHKDGDQLNNEVDNLEWYVSKNKPKAKPEPLQLEGEIWKPVKDFEEAYQVSNLGRVKSLPVLRTSPKTGRKYIADEKILKQPKRMGYYSVNLFCPINKQKGLTVHRLVAEAFIPNPENKPFINHINGIKTDNSISNLEWCTPKENSEHANKTGLHDYKGEDHHLTKLTKKDVLKIRKLHKETALSHRELGKLFNVTKSSITCILNRKTWKHI